MKPEQDRFRAYADDMLAKLRKKLCDYIDETPEVFGWILGTIYPFYVSYQDKPKPYPGNLEPEVVVETSNAHPKECRLTMDESVDLLWSKLVKELNDWYKRYICRVHDQFDPEEFVMVFWFFYRMEYDIGLGRSILKFHIFWRATPRASITDVTPVLYQNNVYTIDAPPPSI
jgi:hypothetical protein